jgi:hypothetical protein
LTVLVGANPLTTLLARTLMEADRKVVVVDSVARKLEPLRRLGVLTVRGDARDASTYENAGVERDTHVLAVTTNDELNLLVAELVREEFGVEHPVVAMQRPSEEFGSKRRAWVDLLGGRGLDVNRWIRWAEADRLAVISMPIETEQAQMTVRDLIRDEEPQAMFLCGWVGGDPLFKPEADDLGRFEAVTLLAVKGEASEALAEHVEGEVEGPPQAWEGPLPEEEPAPLEPSRSGG